VYAAENSESPIFFDRMLTVLRDDYPEISEAAIGYLHENQDETSKHIPLFREMLTDTNSNVQRAGLRSLMSIPNIQIHAKSCCHYSVFHAWKWPAQPYPIFGNRRSGAESISSERPGHCCAIPSHGSDGGSRHYHRNADNQAVASAIPLLKDPEKAIHLRAHGLLTDLTGQNFPADQPEQWEQWWEQNKASFKVSITPTSYAKNGRNGYASCEAWTPIQLPAGSHLRNGN